MRFFKSEFFKGVDKHIASLGDMKPQTCLWMDSKISIRFLEWIFVLSFLFRTSLGAGFPWISLSLLLIRAISCSILSIYYIFLVCHRMKHWRKFILKNSPLNTTATVYSLTKAVGSPLAKLCILCVGSGLVVNEGYKQMFPESRPPIARVGDFIAQKTGYPQDIQPKPTADGSVKN